VADLLPPSQLPQRGFTAASSLVLTPTQPDSDTDRAWACEARLGRLDSRGLVRSKTVLGPESGCGTVVQAQARKRSNLKTAAYLRNLDEPTDLTEAGLLQ
jgi:hypothetical protein